MKAVKKLDCLSFCGRNHSSQADHPAVVGFACVGCRYQLPRKRSQEKDANRRDLFFWEAPQPGDHPKELS